MAASSQDNYVISEEKTTPPAEKDVKETKQTFLKDPKAWVHHQIASGIQARNVVQHLLPEVVIPDHVNDLSLWGLVIEILSEPEPRRPLPHINSLDDAKRLITNCRNIIVLTGAGVSVSCGIPDFRSRDGIYARLSKDFPDLPDPQAMFDIHYFHQNPLPFFKFAKEIYPGQFTPSLCHRFIAHLDKQGKLLRNYTQNIDTLEQVAGIRNVVQCHGSFATASCLNCKTKMKADDIKTEILEQKIPYCKVCTMDEASEGKSNILKPDIVFFGESLPDHFHKQIELDKDKADLLIVIGSSLKVRPVSLIPNLINETVPQILINREPLHHHKFDIEFFGNCDDVISELCQHLDSDSEGIIGNFRRTPLEKKIVEKMLCEAKVFSESEDSNCSENSQDQTTAAQDFPSNAANASTNTGSDRCDTSSSLNVSQEDSECKNNITDQNPDSEAKRKQKSLKRRKETLEERELTKRIRNHSISQKESDIDGEEIYFLSIPPNRYIFHGAELDYFEDESEDESEIESETTQSSEQVPGTSVSLSSKDENTTCGEVLEGTCNGEYSDSTTEIVPPPQVEKSSPDRNVGQIERDLGDTLGLPR